MVSAVFHPSTDMAHPTPAAARSVPVPTAVVPPLPATKKAKTPRDWRALWMAVLQPAVGVAVLWLLWALLTSPTSAIPTPAATFDAAVKLFSDPFYSKGPNDQGIGWNILFSLNRVAVGFGLAALAGIPLGFLRC